MTAAAAVSNEADLLTAARGGDERAFRELTDPHRRVLIAHCYRMLGSLSDAEDMVQETLLRAWRRIETFEGRASFRGWLYKIATNACLDALAARAARTLPQEIAPAADPTGPVTPVHDPIWLEPCPDEVFVGEVSPETPVDPEANLDRRESVALAFLAALQLLPASQRAVLILRGVLGWQATEVAELLETSVPAVNSALQRARSTLEQKLPAGAPPATAALDPSREAAPLARYMQAWESGDPAALVAVLKEDATVVMPPAPQWFHGRDAINTFFTNVVFAGPGAATRYRAVPAPRANGRPAIAVYMRDEATGVFRANGLHLLTLDAVGRVAEIVAFLDPRIVGRFGLPMELPPG